MRTAKVFQSGNSQAVRLPREARFPEHIHDVIVKREGDRLILEPVAPATFEDAFWAVLGSMPDIRRPRQRHQRRKQVFP